MNKMIVYLTPSDFYVTRNNELANNIKGFSVVFFKSSTCKYCKDVEPAFHNASSSLQGCTFAVMDVDQDNSQIVRISNTTLNKLKYVPYVVLYANGIPTAVFNQNESNPDANTSLLKEFIIKTTAQIKAGVKSTTGQQQGTQQRRVCETSTGIALFGNSKRHYMRSEHAYKK